MSKITDYTSLSSTQTDDVLPIVDVHDFTQAGSGTTKKITVANLMASAGGGMSNPMTTLGDIIYENATPAAARLAGNTSATKNFLTQTGTGTVSAAPAWGGIAAADLPTASTSAQGAVMLDGTAADIKLPGDQAAGIAGKAADAAHVHPVRFWQSSDNGLLAANYDPAVAASNGQLYTAGTVYVMKLTIHDSFTINTIWLAYTAAGSGASSGSFAGIYNSSGTRTGVTADLGTPGAGPASYSLTSGVSVTSGSFIWVAVVFNLATTQPTGLRGASAAAAASAGLATTALRFATAATAQTSLPASITPASLGTANANTYWVGLS